MLLILCNLINNPDDCGVDGSILASLSHPCRTSLYDKNPLAKTGMHRVDRDKVTFLVITIRVDLPANKQLFSFEPRILSRRDNGPDNTGEQHADLYLDVFPMGRTSSRFECGLGMTCTLRSSPTRRAAAAPASVAALTAATSPRTIAVT